MTAPILDTRAENTSRVEATPPDRHPSELRVALALGRAEARRLFLRPSSFIVTALGAVAIGSSADPYVDRFSESASSGFLLLPLAAITLINSHRATSRPARDGTLDVADAAPVTARARTAAHLIAVVAPAVFSVVVLAVLMFRAAGPNAYASWVPSELAVGPLLVAGAGALGVLLARLSTRPLVPFVACVVIAVYEANATGTPFIDSGSRWLAFWVDPAEHLLLPARRPGPHLVYLVGLTALAGLAALLRHGRTRVLTVVSLATIAMTVAAAVVQTRPAPADHWAKANRLLTNPDRFLRCDETAGVRFCMLPGQRGLVDAALADKVRAVAAAAPGAAWRDDIVVSQSITPGSLEYTGLKLARKLPALRAAKQTLPRDDGRVHIAPGWGWAPTEELGFGVAVAHRLVGLPTGAGDRNTVCSAAGQARGAIALYLGARSSDRSARELRQYAGDEGTPAGFVLGEIDVYSGTAYDTDQARLALALLDRPRREVRNALSAHWAVLTDARTITAEVARLLGVGGTFAPPGPRPALAPHAIATIGASCA